MKLRPSAGAAAIWAISWWPALNFCAANWQSIRHHSVTSLGGVFVISLALALAGYALYRWRDRRISVVPFWVAAVCLFFGYLAVRNAALAVIADTAFWHWPSSLAWFALSALVFGLLWPARRSVALQRAALTFAFAAPAIASFMLIGSWLRAPGDAGEADATGPAPLSAPEARGNVDVFYIILDAYAGARSLKRDFGFDNSPFIERMAAQGFRDLSTEHSNYLQTAQTLGSIMRLDYAETDDPATWRNLASQYPAALDLSPAPPLIARMKAAGYATWFSGSPLSGCSARYMRCAGGMGAGPIAYTTQAFLAPTPLGRPLRHIFNSYRNALEPLESLLPRLRAENQPAFVFAHHLSPHPPFTLDRNCQPRTDDESDWEVWAASAEAYIEAVRCVNQQAARLVDRIVAADPSAIIVLQGDHGAAFAMNWKTPIDSWSTASITERASYLNLVRAPSRCQRWLDKPLGQVNTARFVVGCAEGRAPDYLPERTWMSTYFDGPEFGIVRRWLPPADEVPR